MQWQRSPWFYSQYIIWQIVLFLLAMSCYTNAFALMFPMPAPGNDVVGQIQTITVQQGDNLANIGKRYGVGIHEMAEANPDIRIWKPEVGAQVIIPTRFVLPPPRKGIIINLPELRLYYFPEHGQSVYTYPIGIGRIGWRTPEFASEIIEKKADPSWHVPDSIRDHVYWNKGVLLPEIVPPGPKNPLGKFALRLGKRSYMIHGTNAPDSVGRRVSSGCIRLHADDIEELFHNTTIGTPTQIINVADKVGWDNNTLYLESHAPLSDDDMTSSGINSSLESVIEQATEQRHYRLDWDQIQHITQQQRGIPEPIGHTHDILMSRN